MAYKLSYGFALDYHYVFLLRLVNRISNKLGFQVTLYHILLIVAFYS